MDVIDPVITCKANISRVNDPGICGATVTIVPATASDNCTVASVNGVRSDALALSAVYPVGVTTITWTATDQSGNQDVCTQTVTITDAEAPVITCPGNVTVQVNASSNPSATGFATATDYCSAAPVITFSDSWVAGTCTGTGVITRTWTATDGALNTSNCVQTITIIDTYTPAITCPADISKVNDPGLCSAVATFTDPVSNDPGYNEGWESNVYVSGDYIGWSAYNSNVISVPSGTNGVNSASGSYHGLTQNPVSGQTGVFSRIGGYTSSFGNGYRVRQSVYMDLNDPAVTANTYGWDLSAASSRQTGGHLRDFIFHTASNSSGEILVAGSNNSNPTRRNDLATINHYTITSSGWYTFEFVFRNNAGALAVDLNLLDAGGSVLWTETRYNPADLISTIVGGNRYLWFTFLEVEHLAIDNTIIERKTSVSPDFASGYAFPKGTTEVTYNSTDACGNTTSCSFDVTVTDTELPIIACPANIAVNNDAGVCGAVVSYSVIYSDNCIGSVLTQTGGLASGSTFPIGVTTNTFLVTDASGNTATCSFTVTVTDTELPIIACPANIAVNNDAGVCGAVVSYSVIYSDNCIGSVLTQTGGLASGSTFPIGVTTNTFLVTDASGNTATCSFTVTVTDTELPVIACPANIAVNNDAGVCGAVVSYSVIYSDNCIGSVLTQTGGLASGSTFPIGVTTNTFLVTDASGNTATCSFTVTVTDTELPVIACPANIAVNNDAGVCGAVVSYSVIYSDNCIGSVLTQTGGLASGSTFPIGVTTNTFLVTDASGNTATCSFTVTVTDTELPVIACPANIAVNNDAGVCGAVVSYSVIYSDNCIGSLLTQTAGLASGSTFPIGVTTNTFLVTDASGNTATCSFTVTVTDTELPVIACPANIAVNNDAGVCGAVVSYSVIYSDNCIGSVLTQTGGLASGSTFPIGVTTNTFLVTDASGNTATCSFTVTVTDTELPVIACPANIAVNNDAGVCGAVVSYSVIYSDNCTGSVLTQTAGLASGSTFPIGVTTNTFLVTDASGNTATCSFTVTVTDTELPVIACPANIAVNNDAGVCGAVVSYSVIYSDNCIGSVLTQTGGLASGSTFPIGVTTNTFLVTDASGNTATCSFTVTVTDTELPVIACPANIAVNNDAGVCGAVVSYSVIYSDNCIGSVLTQTGGLASGSTFPIGVTTNTFLVTDASGNTATCSFTVTVTDTELPIIACPANIAVNNDAGVCGAVVSYSVIYSDNCTGSVLTQTGGLASGSTFPIGVTTNTFLVTDASGNTATCSFTVTVTDTELPIIACPANIAVNNDAGVCGAVVSYSVIYSDNCTGSVLTQTGGLASGSTFPIGVTTNTFLVTDASGNTATCSFTVTVTDTELPVIACPANIAVNNDAGVCGAVVSYSVIYSDNCIGSVLTQTGGLASGSTFPIGVTTNTFLVTDASGNTATCSFTVTVTDTELPVIACPANIAVNNDAGVCGAVVSYSVIYSDNCIGSVLTQTGGLASGSTFPIGVTTNTFLVTDASGNTATCSFTVTVSDTELPSITCPTPANPYTVSTGCSWTGAGLGAIISDNCGTPVLSYSINGGGFIAGDANGYAFPTGTTNVVYKVTDASGNYTTCSFSITVQGVTVSGVINYNNPAPSYPNLPFTPMNNVTVTLRQGITDVYTATTNATGNYTIPGVCEGNYTVIFTTGKPVGGINSSDAAQVNAWGVGPPYTIDKVRFFAGDVLGSNTQINAADAGRILNYFVSGGATPMSPKWTFWNKGETISANPLTTLSKVVTLSVPGGSGPIVQDYYAMVTGDFNMSFVPGGAKSVTENVTLSIGGTTLAEPGVEFELPVTAGIDMEVGAVSLIMNFPTDKLEVTGVFLGSDLTNPMEYAVVGEELRIGWNSLIPVSLQTGEALLTLQLRTIGTLAQGETIRLSLTSDPLNELADGSYNTIQNALLFVDEIGGTTTGVPGVTLNGKLLLENHPNPFVDRTTFTYTLPADGKVTLELSSLLGSISEVLLNEWQTAGTHTFTADLSTYSVGVYTATLRLTGKNDESSRTIKVIRTK